MRAFVASLFLIFADQAVRHLALVRHWPLAPGAHLIQIPGQSLAVIAIGAVMYFLSREQQPVAYVPLVSGALSNILSSLQAKGVIDYIPCGPFYTNGADLLITGGAIWLILRLLRRPERS